METLVLIVFFVVLVGIFAGIPAALVYVRRRNKAAADPAVGQELERLAGERGWSYEAENTTYAKRFDAHFVRSPRVHELVIGSHRGREFACFRYEVVRGARESEQPRGALSRTFYRVVAVRTPAPVPAATQITPAGPGPMFARRWTTGEQDFDEAFQVGAPDGYHYAERLLTVSFRQWLLSHPLARERPLRFERDELLTWIDQKGSRFDVSDLEPTLDYLCDVLDRT